MVEVGNGKIKHNQAWDGEIWNSQLYQATLCQNPCLLLGFESSHPSVGRQTLLLWDGDKEVYKPGWGLGGQCVGPGSRRLMGWGGDEEVEAQGHG